MICHKQRLLFLHPTKTAGTSIEHELLARELWRDADPCVTQRQVYALWTPDSRQHWPYDKMMKTFPFLEGWDSVCTIRHPYDRVISEFWYQIEKGNTKGSSEAHSLLDINMAIRNGSIWTKAWSWHGHPQAGYVGPGTKLIRYENLHDDVREVLGFELQFHKLKRGNRQELKLDDESKALIQQRWPDDFEPLGYDR